jgi:hypothetical protein
MGFDRLLRHLKRLQKFPDTEDLGPETWVGFSPWGTRMGHANEPVQLGSGNLDRGWAPALLFLYIVSHTDYGTTKLHSCMDFALCSSGVERNKQFRVPNLGQRALFSNGKGAG